MISTYYNLIKKEDMKFIVYAALIVAADSRKRGKRDIPDSAIGACNTTADCTAADTYCVFNVTRTEGSDPVWTPSTCGSLADCQVPEKEPEDPSVDSLEEWWQDWFGDEDGMGKGTKSGFGTKQFCKEFRMKKREDSAMRLCSAGATAAVAVAMTL